jgi:Na+/H+ antiporter NhaC
MELTNWIVVLAITLISITFFCGRTAGRPGSWSQENRVRRFSGTRLLMQAALSLWAALLILVRGVFALNGLPGLPLEPPLVIAGAAILVAFGGYWSIRGAQLLKPRRIFSAY